MKSGEVIAGFKTARQKVYSRLDELRGEVDAWVAAHEDSVPSLSEIARFEYLLSERHKSLAEVTHLEDRLIRQLLEAHVPELRPLSPGISQPQDKPT